MTETFVATATATTVVGLGTPVRDGAAGAAVGLAVGLLLGALLGGGVIFYCSLRQIEEPFIIEAPPEPPRPDAKKGISAADQVYNSRRPGKLRHGLESFALNSICEVDYAKTLQIDTLVVMEHVSRFYNATDDVPLPDSFDESLERLVPSGPAASKIKGWLVDTKTRQLGISHLLMRVIYCNMDVHKIGPLSLLPPGLTAFMTSIPSDEYYANINIQRRLLLFQPSYLAMANH
jgi:hypothetical protein